MQLYYDIILELKSGKVRSYSLLFNDEFDYLFWRKVMTNRGYKIIKTTKV